MRGNKRTFPNFHICISINSNVFQMYKTLERRWHDFFHLKRKGFLKIFEFHMELFQIQKLYATQWFSWEKIKWLLQNIWNMSWKFKRIKLKVPFEIILILELFGFYTNYFSPKIKYMEIRVKWFPTIENWREISLKLFEYF